jgi:hypothetical protein
MRIRTKQRQMFFATLLTILAIANIGESYNRHPMYFGDRKVLFLLAGAVLTISLPWMATLALMHPNQGLGWRAFRELPVVTASWAIFVHFVGKSQGDNAFWGSKFIGGNAIGADLSYAWVVALAATLLAFAANTLLLSRPIYRRTSNHFPV